MAEVVGSIAAVAQLAGGMVKATSILIRYAEDYSNAPKEVNDFALETSNLTGVLDLFGEVAERALQNTVEQKKDMRRRLVQNIERQCSRVMQGIKALIRRFRKLVHGETASWQAFVERLRWIFNKPDVRELRLSIKVAMGTVQSLTAVLTLNELLSREGDHNDERTRMYKKRAQNSQALMQNAQFEIKKHWENHGKMYDPAVNNSSREVIFQAEAIEEYVVKALKAYEKASAKSRGTDESNGGAPNITAESRPGPDVNITIHRAGKGHNASNLHTGRGIGIRYVDNQRPEPDKPDTPQRLRRQPAPGASRPDRADRRRSVSQTTYRDSDISRGSNDRKVVPSWGPKTRPQQRVLRPTEAWAALSRFQESTEGTPDAQNSPGGSQEERTEVDDDSSVESEEEASGSMMGRKEPRPYGPMRPSTPDHSTSLSGGSGSYIEARRRGSTTGI